MTKLFALLRGPPRRLMALAAACAFLLGLPSVFHGFLLDDYVHRYAARGLPGPMSGLQLFNFASGDPATLRPFVETGPYPWWTDLELRLVLFRPISSALVYVDDFLFADSPAPYHLHNLLWSITLVLAAALVLRRLFGGALFGAALVLFTFDEARWLPTAWIANRNSLVAGTFVMLAFALHLRWRQDGTKWAAPLSAVLLALGFCSAEAGLAIVGFFLAWALVERSARSLTPLACVLVPYVVVYKLVHGGAHGSGIYLDPLDSPLAYALAAPGRFAALVGNMGLNLPIDLWLTAPQLIPALMILGALTLVFAVMLLSRARAALTASEKKSLDVLALGTLIALLPVLATFPASRMVMIPGLGAAGVIAIALRHLWRTKRFVALGLLVWIHVPFATGLWLLNQAVFDRMGRFASEAVAKTELERDRSDLRVIVLTTGDAPTGLYVPIQRTLLGSKAPARYWILSGALKSHRLVRTAENALELEVIDGRFIDTVFEQIVRTPKRPFFVGDQIQLAGAMVEVLVVEGWAPKKIRITIDRSLEADDVRLLVWRDGALRRLTPPAIGALVELPFSEGVMAKAARPDD